jgi:glycosyltransferase involved in cell wall biosynthesis
MKGKTRVIENGIDIGRTLKQAEACVKQSLDRNVKHIGFLGRLSPVKRPDILLDVAELTVLHKKLPYVFHLIGDGPLFHEIKTRIAEKNLANHVLLHGFHSNPIPLLAAMDSLLITSDHEGLPTNLLEAMCLGIPVVAHAVGEIPRVLEYGKLGTLVKEQNPERYADAIAKCLSMPRPDRHISALFSRINDHYSADRNAEQYLNLYHEILSLKSARECPGF